MPQHREQRRVETPRCVAGGRRHEFVVEPELVEEGAEPRIVMRGEAVMGAERIRHLGQRLAEMPRHHLLVGDVVRHFAQPVHVVGKGDQPGLDLVVGENAKGMAHHGGARDFAERADMRQAGRPIAGLEITSSFGLRLSRATILRASSNGQACESSANSRSEAAWISAVVIACFRLSGKGQDAARISSNAAIKTG